uniref:Glycolipid transfer protein domain-containing protein n=1 Tax=Rhodosorus marinus TaxID=101924 RepID=A0A7S3ELB8_9RHOD|mmetsp:Transcript_41996/g.164547  ORF Transcript_41996/g.164547 Transcript_41996/m.164547 type:complete len:272 (+) Transcript_41996:245-1060(+)
MSGLAHVMSDLGEILWSFRFTGVHEERNHREESGDRVTGPSSEEKIYHRVQSAPLLKCMVETLSNESENVNEIEAATDVDSVHTHGLVELLDGNDSEEFPESSVTSDESSDEDTASRLAVSGLVESFEETAEDDPVWSLVDAIKLAGEVTAVEDGIEHDMFATATADGFNKIIDALLTGMMPAHGIVRRDTRTNLQKIEEGCSKIGKSNLREMVEAEIAQSVEWSNSGREAVLWLKRTLQFLCFALRDFVKSVRPARYYSFDSPVYCVPCF